MGSLRYVLTLYRSTIPITFTQIASDAVGQIVINDEVITNSTGSDWTGFQFQLLVIHSMAVK